MLSHHTETKQKKNTARCHRTQPLSQLSQNCPKMLSPKTRGTNFKNTTPTFPKSEIVVFGHLMGYECLSLFRGLVANCHCMIREEPKPGNLNLSISFWEKKKEAGYRKDSIKG